MSPVLVAAGVVAVLVAALLLAEALVWAMAARTMDRVDAAESRRRRELSRALTTGDRPRRWTDGGAS